MQKKEVEERMNENIESIDPTTGNKVTHKRTEKVDPATGNIVPLNK
jgi:hypothetical protein